MLGVKMSRDSTERFPEGSKATAELTHVYSLRSTIYLCFTYSIPEEPHGCMVLNTIIIKQ